MTPHRPETLYPARGHVRVPADLDMLITCTEIAANGALRRARSLADAGDPACHAEIDTLYTLRALELLDDGVSATWIADIIERFRRATAITVTVTEAAQ